MKKIVTLVLLAFILSLSVVFSAPTPSEYDNCPRSDSYRGPGFWKGQWTRLGSKSVQLSEEELETAIDNSLTQAQSMGLFDGWRLYPDVFLLFTEDHPTQEQRDQVRCLVNMIVYPK